MRTQRAIEQRLNRVLAYLKTGKDEYGFDVTKSNKRELVGEFKALAYVLTKDVDWLKQHSWVFNKGR